MKYLLLCSAILVSITAIAQDCSMALILQKPGTWKAGMKGSEGGTATDLAREKANVLALHSQIKSRYTPMAVEANFQGSYDRPYGNTPANSWSYNIIPLPYYCDGNTIKTAHETSGYFSITANRFEAEIFDTAQGEVLLAEGFHSIKDMPTEKNGTWYFKDRDVSLGFGMTGKQSKWLVTYNGKLPFAYVTKKEFLEKRKSAIATQLNMTVSGFKDVLATKEIEKKFKETEYKNDPVKLKKYMEMDYLNIKARYEKMITDFDKTYQPVLDKIAKQLKMSPAELARPAIVKHDPADNLSYLFTDDDDVFSKVLIKPNPDYFNKKIARSSPQFFWISVQWNNKEPVASDFTTGVLKAVDFANLQSMLGK
jgi:hypothetical protein